MIRFANATSCFALLLVVACSNDTPSAPSASEVSDPGEYSSVYTDISEGNCTTIEVSEEGQGTLQRCGGLNGMDIYVSEGDGRFTISAGQAPDHYVNWSPFNSPGANVEWRLSGETPVAIIYRLKSAVSEAEYPETGRLVVATLPSNGESGCAAYFVPDSVAAQNEIARELADGLPSDFDCTKQPVTYSGEEK